jgi:dipeptidyl-peptidase-3
MQIGFIAGHGSKSVSLGNIIDAYSKAGGKESCRNFGRKLLVAEKYGEIGDKLHTALQWFGHASGQINAGVGTPKKL